MESACRRRRKNSAGRAAESVGAAYTLRAAFRNSLSTALFPAEVLNELYGTLGDVRVLAPREIVPGALQDVELLLIRSTVRVDEAGRALADGPQVEIGGNDRYVSVSRREFKKVMRGEGEIAPLQPPLPLGD